MTKAHLKRLAAPKEWAIKRKTIKFVIRPKGGLNSGMPLGIIMRDILGYAKNMREVRTVLRIRDVLVDGVKRTDARFSAGIMSTLSVPEMKEHFRIALGKDKKLKLIKIKEAESLVKICKIKNKKILKGGKIQLNLHDGSNIICEKPECGVGDSVMISLPKKEVKSCLKLEKGALIYLTGGEHVGTIGKVEGIDKARLIVKSEKSVIETMKKFAIVIGTEKPLCTVVENE
ncbi:30S ribosomal protein S4e [Candidatus Woesearchaeota archaeon]|nr:30S ribosomal protein S4e [Candidatus Woesearchaeota archaeon]